MVYQYFTSKLKDEYLVEIIKENLSNGTIKNFYPYSYEILSIDKKYLRKLKIQNIENDIQDKDKTLLEFLINENYVKMLTQSEFEEKTNYNRAYNSGTSGYSGTSGPYGVSGVSGTYGVSGCSGVSGTTIKKLNTTKHWELLGLLE